LIRDSLCATGGGLDLSNRSRREQNAGGTGVQVLRVDPRFVIA